MSNIKHTKEIFDFYFIRLLQKCGVNDNDCFSEIQSATSEMVKKIQELEDKIEQLEKK